MNIDIQSENIVTFREAVEHLPRVRRGRKLNQATIYRWAREGRRGVILESIPVGGTLCTSLEALQRFFEALGRQRGQSPKRRAAARAATEDRDREILQRARILDRPGAS